jgi:MoxR-like ATPase
MSNLIDVNLSTETKDSVLQAISATKLAMPFLIKLSDSDRKSLQPIDDGRKPFVEKSIDFASRNPVLDPGSGMLQAAPNDVSLYSFLSIAENELSQLLEMVRDTKQAAGSEAYDVARFIYMKAKMNVKMGVPGSQAIVDELSKLYKQNASPAKTAEVK